MKSRTLRILSLLLLLSFASRVFALSEGRCDKETSIAAEKQAGQAGSWGQLFQAFTKFARCDDGAIAEGFDESVDRLLARKDPNYTELSVLVRQSKRFRSFVLRHVAGTGNGNEILAAGRNALACYVRTKMVICKDIAFSVAKGFDEAVLEISGMEANGTATKDQVAWKEIIQQFLGDYRRIVPAG